MNRSEHLQWAKNRAIEILETTQDVQGAWASMLSDLNKHKETQGHIAIGLGMMQMMANHLNTISEMKNFIEGFN